MARVCLGEFDWPDKRGKREFLQLLFLNTLEELDQAPLRELYDKPFALYRTGKNDFHLDYGFFTHHWWLTGAARSLVETLETEIEAWATTWNLNADWCKQTALATLHAWSCASREIKELYFQHPGGGGAVPTAPDPPEGLPKYDAYSISREYYLESVRAKALSVIAENPLLNLAPKSKTNAFVDSILVKAKAYCRTVEAVYVDCHWKPGNEKRNLNQHLEWTVKFQVFGKTFNELAKAEDVEQPTVSRAVRDILSVLPLPKRPNSRPGRIRGSKNTRPGESKIRRHLGKS